MAAKDQPVVLPKNIAGKVRVSAPTFRTDAQSIVDGESKFINQSVNVLRSTDPIKAIKALTRFSGVFSTAVHTYVQLAMSGYTVTAYSAGTHEYDPVGTAAAIGLMSSADTLYDYTLGYGDKQSVDGTLETLLKETIQTGACASELVLNKYLLPDYFATIPITSLFKWKPRKDGTKFPVQRPPAGGDEIELDKATIFYAAMHQPTDTIYPRSPLEAALQTAFEFGEFVEDIYRILRKSGHSRMVVTLMQETVMKNLPPKIMDDPEKVKAYLDNVRTEVELVLKNLDPDDALVLYDSAKIEILGTKGEKSDYTGLLDTFAGMLATGLKTMPSVLGMRLSGSQALSNTESLVYLKEVTSIQQPVETVMSRMLTLSVRLAAGTDSYVKFRFKPVDIRPESELSAHRSVDRQGVLQLLSLGYYTDDEASHLLGTGPRAPGAPNLSGTMFMNPVNAQTDPNTMPDGNSGPQQRTLSEGTSKGSATSKGGGGKNK